MAISEHLSVPVLARPASHPPRGATPPRLTARMLHAHRDPAACRLRAACRLPCVCRMPPAPAPADLSLYS
jgi:hypothetical protein